jgi:dTDP-4-amino-4,6-dideoxygalactose transaminase
VITIASPVIEDEEIKAVNRVLRSGRLAQGPKVAELEMAIADYCGAKYAVAVNSGTAALHTALFAAGVGPGDEVITTPYSFIATINAILILGATPVLVDVDPTTFNIDTKRIEAAVTTKTKAIIPVDLYGQPCDYQAIRRIAKAHQLIVIEDACQAIGAEYNNKKTGSLTDLGCFSLYATKNITAGEGGMITTNNKTFEALARRFRQHGMNSQYEYRGLGLNYRLSDLHASIAVEQLKKIERFNKAHQHNAKQYDEGLKQVKGISLPIRAANRTHVFHQYTVRVTNDFPLTRDQLVKLLHDKGITAGVYYPKPLHYYAHVAKLGYTHGDFPEAELAAVQTLSLPIHSSLRDKDSNYIINTLRTI